MRPNPDNLLKTAGITTPLIGFYDVPDTKPFEPFAIPERCLFSTYNDWVMGKSIILSEDKFGCPGAGYWLCGVKSQPQNTFASFLFEHEGLKSSTKVINEWLNNQKPYKKKHKYIVIGPLKKEHYDYLQTVTFYVNPDQLSLLMMGAEYHNSSIANHQVIFKFGSGCAQLVALFEDLSLPKAILGSTDITMRQHLPNNILALTVTKPMFKRLCELDKNSFLYKPFWGNLKKTREEKKNPSINNQ